MQKGGTMISAHCKLDVHRCKECGLYSHISQLKKKYGEMKKFRCLHCGWLFHFNRIQK